MLHNFDGGDDQL